MFVKEELLSVCERVCVCVCLHERERKHVCVWK